MSRDSSGEILRLRSLLETTSGCCWCMGCMLATVIHGLGTHHYEGAGWMMWCEFE